MIGLILALIVVGIILTFFGAWIFAIPLGIVALVLFVLFILGWGRRAAREQP
jgi:hypothetical protein